MCRLRRVDAPQGLAQFTKACSELDDQICKGSKHGTRLGCSNEVRVPPWALSGRVLHCPDSFRAQKEAKPPTTIEEIKASASASTPFGRPSSGQTITSAAPLSSAIAA